MSIVPNPTSKSTEIDRLLIRYLTAHHRAGRPYLYFVPGTEQARAFQRLHRRGLVTLAADDDGLLAARLTNREVRL